MCKVYSYEKPIGSLVFDMNVIPGKLSFNDVTLHVFLDLLITLGWKEDENNNKENQFCSRLILIRLFQPFVFSMETFRKRCQDLA